LTGANNARHSNRGAVALAILLLFICSATAVDSVASSAKKLGTVITGKFVARVDGPLLTGFGENYESYIFQMDSPAGTQFVRLSDTFLIYQPHLPVWALDYSKVYKLTALRDEKCDDTLENISRRYIFDSHGQFLEMKAGLTYAQNLPILALPWQGAVLCYVMSPVQPGAKILTEVSPAVPN
jgi:hypothetical protein